MRTIEIEDGNELKLHGSALTLFYFEEEFDEDMLGKIVELAALAQNMQSVGKELESGNLAALQGIKVNTLLKIAWALNKTAKGGVFPSLEEWLRNHEYISPFNFDLIEAIVQETMNGCFRGATDNGEVPEIGEEGEE